MYEILKKLLPAAETIGTVETVRQTVKDPKFYVHDEITIKGITADGKAFTLHLEVEEKE
jgi:hypothetical protein